MVPYFILGIPERRLSSWQSISRFMICQDCSAAVYVGRESELSSICANVDLIFSRSYAEKERRFSRLTRKFMALVCPNSKDVPLDNNPQM